MNDDPIFTVFDIDNCLSNDIDRIPLIDWSADNPNDRYDPYHLPMGEDDPANGDLFHAALKFSHVVLITARPEKYSIRTAAWFLRKFKLYIWDWGSTYGKRILSGQVPHNLRDPKVLIWMRPDDNHEPSVRLKAQALLQLGEQFDEEGNPSRFVMDNIACAFDDHHEVVQMYRRRGIRARQLAIHDVSAYHKPESK